MKTCPKCHAPMHRVGRAEVVEGEIFEEWECVCGYREQKKRSVDRPQSKPGNELM